MLDLCDAACSSSVRSAWTEHAPATRPLRRPALCWSSLACLGLLRAAGVRGGVRVWVCSPSRRSSPTRLRRPERSWPRVNVRPRVLAAGRRVHWLVAWAGASARDDGRRARPHARRRALPPSSSRSRSRRRRRREGDARGSASASSSSRSPCCSRSSRPTTRATSSSRWSPPRSGCRPCCSPSACGTHARHHLEPQLLRRLPYLAQAANIWLFAAPLGVALLPRTLALDQSTFPTRIGRSRPRAFGIGLAALALLAIVPRRRISPAFNLLVALGSLFLVVQLVQLERGPRTTRRDRPAGRGRVVRCLRRQERARRTATPSPRAQRPRARPLPGRRRQDAPRRGPTCSPITTPTANGCSRRALMARSRR